MATITAPISQLKAPVKENGGKWNSKKGVVDTLNRIKADYGTYIQNISKLTNVPQDVIMSVIAVESGGKPTAGASGHVTQGLMQLNRNYAKSNLEKELKEGRMSEGEKSILRKFGVMDSKGNIRAVTNADQLKPELNILIGTILVGQMMDTDWGTTKTPQGNRINMDRIIAVYNAGAYGDTGKKARQITSPKLDDAVKLSQGVNPITRSYIAKILGTDGTLDAIKKNNIV
jgi:soluble lytic murein transglycosylase-like protein